VALATCASGTAVASLVLRLIGNPAVRFRSPISGTDPVKLAVIGFMLAVTTSPGLGTPACDGSSLMSTSPDILFETCKRYFVSAGALTPKRAVQRTSSSWESAPGSQVN